MSPRKLSLPHVVMTAISPQQKTKNRVEMPLIDMRLIKGGMPQGLQDLGHYSDLGISLGFNTSLQELPCDSQGILFLMVNKIHQAGIRGPPNHKIFWVMMLVILSLSKTDVRGKSSPSFKGPPISSQLLVCTIDKQALSFSLSFLLPS